uniref:Receptor ligand binding region domain-containing protein n=1 Tax=Panagrolaimus superbus TaxID=310955 RepID=A0A914YDB7_9BILA
MEIFPLIDTSKGCGIGSNRYDGAALAMQYYYNNNISALFGPVCPDDLEITTGLSMAWNILQFNFWRDSNYDIDSNSIVQMSTSSASNIAANIVSVLNLLNWAKIGIVQCSDCYEASASLPSAFETIKRVLEERGIEVLITIECSKNNLTNIEQFATILKELNFRARIILPFFGNSLTSYTNFLRAFKKAGLAKNDYSIIITLAQYSLATPKPDTPWIVNGVVDQEILGWYDNVIVLMNDYYDMPIVQNYITTHGNMAIDKALVYIQFYEAIFLYNTFLKTAYNSTKNPQIYQNSTIIINSMRNQKIVGPFGQISLDGNNQRLGPFRTFVILTEKNGSIGFINITYTSTCGVGVKSFDKKCTALTADLINPNMDYVKTLPPDIPSCGFHSELCDQKGTIIIVVAVMGAVSIAITIFLCARKMKSGESASMPWAVASSTVRFIDENFKGSTEAKNRI